MQSVANSSNEISPRWYNNDNDNDDLLFVGWEPGYLWPVMEDVLRYDDDDDDDDDGRYSVGDDDNNENTQNRSIHEERIAAVLDLHNLRSTL